MKNWSQSQYITYTILLLLLVTNFSQSFLVLIYDDLLDPVFRGSQVIQLRIWVILLYGLLLFGSFPIIAVVIWLNRDDLHRLNIDNYYALLLIYAGLAGLFYLPYNIITILAVIYLVVILFSGRVKFGVLDPSGLRIILVIVGVYVGFLCLRIGFDNVASLDFLRSGESARHQVLEVMPIAIYEEAIYRGMLYMFLKDLGLSASKTLYAQAFLFWITHINYLIENPLFFWFGVPVLGLVLGYIAVRSRSLTPSTIAHILYNSL